jgi:hypothetical protein
MVEKVADPRKVKKVDIEPNAVAIKAGESGYQTQLMRALSWYHAEQDRKDATKFARSWIKQHMPESLIGFDKARGEVTPTFGWLCRIHQRGAVLSDLHVNKIRDYMRVYAKLQANEVVVAVKATPRPSIQESMDAKAREYLGNIEGALDDFLKEGKDFDIEADLKGKEIPKAYAPKIEQFLKNKLREIIEVIEAKDKDLVEGYSNLKKKHQKDYAKFLAGMIEGLNKYAAFKQANRKPRPKKAKPPTVQVAKLQYLKEHAELKLNSVSPVEIIGASQAWIYNVKSKKLSVYRTDSGQGLQCKGTRLQNYDPDMSDMRTLRKPADQTQEILNAGKVQLRKFMEALTTKAANPNGIVNADCIILRVIK